MNNDCNSSKTIVPDQSFLQVFAYFHLYFVPSVHCSFMPLLLVTEQLLLSKSISTVKLAYAKLTYLSYFSYKALPLIIPAYLIMLPLGALLCT